MRLLKEPKTGNKRRVKVKNNTSYFFLSQRAALTHHFPVLFALRTLSSLKFNKNNLLGNNIIAKGVKNEK